MRKPTMLLAILGVGAGGGAGADNSIPNQRIDMAQYLKVAHEAAAHRETHRVTEAQFIQMSRDPGTIVLDARSREKYDLLHVRGAINLSFPDITVESLARVLPDTNARILIYCNNNFENDQQAFPTKAPAAALNVSTFISLYTYGYRNVYELGPLLDVKHTKISLEPTRR
jgi:rhodanese-like protein